MTAERFSMKICAHKALNIYASLLVQGFVRRSIEDSPWTKTGRLIQAEWELVKNFTKATGALIGLPRTKPDFKEYLIA